MPFFGSDVADILSVSSKAMRNQFTRWKKQGLLIELKRGLYALSGNERQTPLSKEVAAANIYQPSYISMESAMARYKMIPEKVSAVTSVTTRKTRSFRNREGTFIYRSLKPGLYFGFTSKKDEHGYPFFIAEPEKALLDHLYLNLGSIDPDDTDFFAGSLRLQNRAILNRKKLASYAKRFGIKKLTRVLEQLK
jgi:predicted transcriptional regulator of viral defense system